MKIFYVTSKNTLHNPNTRGLNGMHNCSENLQYGLILLLHELLNQWEWQRVDQPLALLTCYGSPGFFDSGLQLISVVGCRVSHLPLDKTYNIHFLWGSDQASLLTNQAQ